jgi:3-methyladenine DNA glycosylase AlkD
MLEELKKDLQEEANPEQAKILQRFFKTGAGEYGEGDVFLGIRVPVQRAIAKKYVGLNFPKLQELLDSKIHDHRMACLFILIDKYKKADEEGKGDIFNFYLSNTANINNWDLVDISCYKIVGEFLLDKEKDVLYKLAESKDLWEKRIAMISTFAFIRKEEFGDALAIAEILLEDEHDLIHKAVGWMLREVGKKNLEVEEAWLQENGRYKKIPRTMLRYAIEKFEERKRKRYLKGEI